jgi:pSer/pThr/pTyr-binding forkhead associated (FHA) protein
LRCGLPSFRMEGVSASQERRVEPLHPMHATILITKGKGQPKKVTVELPVIVGRAPDVGLSIAHPAISRQHCEIVEAAGFVKVRDLGSTNGVRVGSKKVPEAVLRPHGKFSIGPLTFQVDYHYVGEATQVISDFDDEEEEAEENAAPSAARRRGPAAEPEESPEDWAESDDVYGLAIEPAAPAEAAEATPPPNAITKPKRAAGKPEEPRRGDFMRTPKATQKRLPDAPTPASESGYDLQGEPAAGSPPAEAPQAAKPARKQTAAPTSTLTTDRPFDLERELDEMLDGLKGMDLNEFLKGIM